MADPYGIYKNVLSVKVARIGDFPAGSYFDVDNQGNVSFNNGAKIATTLALGAFGDAAGIALSDSSLVALGIYPELAAVDDVLGAGLVAYGIRNRFLINKAQTNNVSLYATQGQLRVKANLAAGVHSGLFGYLEQSGTVTLSSSGAFNSACNLAVETSAGLTLDSGVNLECLTITGIIASGTLNGNINGIHIRKAGAVSWTNGILIEGCTTGIDILTGTTIGVSIGTNAAKMALASTSVRALASYTTSSIISGTISSLTINQTMTAAATGGGHAEVAQFILTSNVKVGGWGNAMFAKIDFQTNGLVHGLAGVICSELTMPGSSVVRGEYTPMEIEINCPTNCVMNGNPINVFQINVWGAAATQFDAVGRLFDLTGVSSGATSMWYDHQGSTPGNIEEWVKVKTPGGIRYLMLVDAVV